MADNSTTPLSPSAPFDTPTDHRSLLNVIGWLFIIISFMVVATRFGTQWAVLRMFGCDDAFISISLLLATGSMIAVTIGVENGLGLLDWKNGSQEQLNNLQKSAFSFNILFILSQAFSKLSVLIFIRSLTPKRLHRNLVTLSMILTVCWGITAGFGSIFHCDPPQVWRFLDNKCINRMKFNTAMEIFNMFLDIVLILLPILVVWDLKLPLNPKLVVVSCFLPRICVVAALIVQLIILYGEDKTYEPFLSWSFVVITLLAQCLGIVSACILYLKPFLKSVSSGMMGNDDLRRRGCDNNPSSSYERYASAKAISKKKISNLLSSVTDTSPTIDFAKDDGFPHNMRGIQLNDHPMRPDLRNDRQVSVLAQIGESECDSNSQSSRSNKIYQTKTFVATSIHDDDKV